MPSSRLFSRSVKKSALSVKGSSRLLSRSVKGSVKSVKRNSKSTRSSLQTYRHFLWTTQVWPHHKYAVFVVFLDS